MSLSPASSVSAAEAGLESCYLRAWATPIAESNFDNSANDSSNPYRASDNTDGAWVEYALQLAAGQWALNMLFAQGDAFGIASFLLNDGSGLVPIDDPPYSASAATKDTYAAAFQGLIHATVATDITIPESGDYTLRLAVDGKNASSSGFQVLFYELCLTRVGS